MSNKKQSSVEFAIEKITQFMTEDNDFELGLIAEKLKAMHKEEIEQSYMSGAYDKVTRLEVISEEGRELVKYKVGVELHLQDEGRTLKVFTKIKGGWE